MWYRYHVCKTKDDQTTGFPCIALTFLVEWQEGHLAHKNLVVVPVSLSYVRAPAHPGYHGSKEPKFVRLCGTVTISQWQGYILATALFFNATNQIPNCMSKKKQNVCRMKGWVGLVGWRTADVQHTHINGYPSAASPVQTSESSMVRDRRSTTEPPNRVLSPPML